MTHKAPSHPPRDQHVGGAEEPPDHHNAPQAVAPDAIGQAADREPYAVGYGRPPLHSRFKPGQSGNPKGRAKGSRNLRTILKQVSNEQIQIREGDRTRRMSMMEALVRKRLHVLSRETPKRSRR
jgi:hypothetical protein